MRIGKNWQAGHAWNVEGSTWIFVRIASPRFADFETCRRDIVDLFPAFFMPKPWLSELARIISISRFKPVYPFGGRSLIVEAIVHVTSLKVVVRKRLCVFLVKVNIACGDFGSLREAVA